MEEEQLLSSHNTLLEQNSKHSPVKLRFVKYNVNTDALMTSVINLKINNDDITDITQLKSTVNSLIDKVYLLSGVTKALTKLITAETKSRMELEDNLKTLHSKNNKLNDKIYELEKDLINVDQYQRRNNLEIVGIPSNVPQKKLEKLVLEIINKMDVKTHGEKIS